MDVKGILSKCDHTLLAQTATWKEIQAICDDGMKYAAPVSASRQLCQAGGGVGGREAAHLHRHRLPQRV